MNENIIQFLKEQTCSTICCLDEQQQPWCFSCFYAFNAEEGLLYYKSAADSHHSVFLINNPIIAGTILPDKLNKLVVKGIQFQGVLLDFLHPKAAKASFFYHKKHPLALAVPGDMWTVKMEHIKMTDSTLGFGKKILWNRKTFENLVK